MVFVLFAIPAWPSLRGDCRLVTEN